MRAMQSLQLEALELRTMLSTYNVNITADGVAGSLRDAIAKANANPGLDVIVLHGDQFNLTASGAAQDADGSADLDVTDDLRIVGTGPSGGSAIDANRLDRVLEVNGASLELDHITITGGQGGAGGGILANNADLIINDSTIRGNNAVDTGGGIAAVGGSVSIADSIFSNNTVTGSFQARGGAIYAQSSTLAVATSQFAQNSVSAGSSDGLGGAVNIVFGSASISGSTFEENQANSASGGGGGAVAIDRGGDLLVTDSLFDSNSVNAATPYGGGALAAYFSSLMHVVNSVIQNNSANSTSSIAGGGGIFLVGTDGLIESTTISNNRATAPSLARGGGIEFLGLPSNTLTIRDSTITGNSADASLSFGGGVDVLSGSATVDSDTVIAGNSATIGPDTFGTVIIVPD